MKLRLAGNFIRLRLSQTDVSMLKEKSRVTETTFIGPRSLRYSICVSPNTEDIEAKLLDDEIEVTAPLSWTAKWFLDDQVSMENLDQVQKRILIEKDFQCLHKRTGEDESDNYPNPQANSTS